MVEGNLKQNDNNNQEKGRQTGQQQLVLRGNAYDNLVNAYVRE